MWRGLAVGALLAGGVSALDGEGTEVAAQAGRAVFRNSMTSNDAADGAEALAVLVNEHPASPALVDVIGASEHHAERLDGLEPTLQRVVEASPSGDVRAAALFTLARLAMEGAGSRDRARALLATLGEEHADRDSRLMLTYGELVRRNL